MCLYSLVLGKDILIFQHLLDQLQHHTIVQVIDRILVKVVTNSLIVNAFIIVDLKHFPMNSPYFVTETKRDPTKAMEV